MMIHHPILGELTEEEYRDGEYELFIENPVTPQDHFMNDMFISLQQMQAGDTVDAEESLKKLRIELGLDAD